MSSSTTFQEKSYEQQLETYDAYQEGGNKAETAKSWFKTGTVDYWRHQRLYETLNPLLQADPQGRWLTVGDGRYGRDAKYIADQGCDVLATDLTDTLLKEAKDIGFIPDFRTENAEALSFDDNSYDYVYCKEAYHHFPRPAIALYEMLRVARKGVVLTEPNDPYIIKRVTNVLFRDMKALVKKILRGDKIEKHHFEDVGNYVYTISRREIEKVALGVNYKVVAFKGVNDAYFKGVENEEMEADGPLQKKVRRLIGGADLLCKLGLMDYGLMTAVIFKQMPPRTLLQRMASDGYEVVRLPDNPYIKDAQ